MDIQFQIANLPQAINNLIDGASKATSIKCWGPKPYWTDWRWEISGWCERFMSRGTEGPYISASSSPTDSLWNAIKQIASLAGNFKWGGLGMQGTLYHQGFSGGKPRNSYSPFSYLTWSTIPKAKFTAVIPRHCVILLRSTFSVCSTHLQWWIFQLPLSQTLPQQYLSHLQWAIFSAGLY